LIVASWCNASVASGQFVFSHFAGTTGGAGASDGTGSAARFASPQGVAVDALGYVYVADSDNHVIRRMSPAGVVTTIAGAAGVEGTADGARDAARFNRPKGLALDENGTLYVADHDNCAIRTISPDGVVDTLAGSPGSCGSTDATGTAARFLAPTGIAVDASGTLYVADTGNHTIRRITATGVVTTLAGQAGTSGSSDGTGSAARFASPWGIAIGDSATIFVTDLGNHTVRAVSQAGVVTTFAGTAGQVGSANGVGPAARFYSPAGLAIDAAGNLFVSEALAHTIRKITPSATVSLHVGGYLSPGTADGSTSLARFNGPLALTITAADTIYVADSGNHAIRAISVAWVVSTPAGAPPVAGSTNATGSAARFNRPDGLAVDASGNLYVADRVNHVIRRITSAGQVTTLAGNAGSAGSTDATGSAARFRLPYAVTVDASGVIYVADSSNHAIRRITAGGVVTTLAGLAGSAGSADGSGTAARFSGPMGIAVDAAGTVFVADSNNHTIRKITSTGVVSTFAGTAGAAGSTNATGTAARFNKPTGIAIDLAGTLFVVDQGNHTIRTISPAGVVGTLAGSPGSLGATDGAGAAARFRFPSHIGLDGAGDLYVTDTQNHAIRRVTPSGVVTTIGGTFGEAGASDGAGVMARFSSPLGIAVDAAGAVYVGDEGNHAVRRGVVGAEATATLTLSKTGAGSGTVDSEPAGISCGTDCAETLSRGTRVTLVANASPGSVFAGWSGAGCSGLGSCVVELAATTAVSARFLPDGPVVLSVTKSGSGDGTIVSTPAGISCGADCSEPYPVSTVVVLTVTPVSGTVFTGWSGGGCTGTGICVVTLVDATTVNAGFLTEGPPTARLSVAKLGTGDGTVTSAPAGISCGSDCSQTYVLPVVVTLTASPAAGSVFEGWTGAGCSGTSTCVAVLTADVTVTARFSLVTPPRPQALSVSVDGTGSGTVTSSPAGISCGSDCAESYAHGTLVSLAPVPAAGAFFLGWSGDCTGLGACDVSMTSARSVTATFGLAPPPSRTLTVSRTGSGTGTVTSSPAGISCGSDCSETYAPNTSVTLSATAAPGSVFAGWSGPCSGTSTCVVTLSASVSVDAVFGIDSPPPQATLTVVRAGTGSGLVSSTPGGIACGGDCTNDYDVGTVVTLQASTDLGSTFEGWSGAGCSGTGTCVVPLDAARTVTATFTATVPQARTMKVYLAEGATSSFIDTRLALLNPGDVDTTATVTFQLTGGAPVEVTLDVAAKRRVTLYPKDIPGLENAEFATQVESERQLVVDRTLSWDVANGYGAHAETAVPDPSLTWYLAEGATHSGFNLFYLMQNPNPVEAQVRVRFFRPSGSPLEKTYTLLPASRTNIWVNLEEFPGLGAALAATDVSASFESLNGQPIIVERALYLDRPGQPFAAGHASAGVVRPATAWFLAEGATGPYFDLFLLIANPTNNDAEVEAAFLLPDGTVIVKRHTVKASTRYTVWVDGQDPLLANTAVSTSMVSTNGVPIIVERAQWWPGTFEQWYEAHNSPGATQTLSRWAMAEGEVGGPRGIDTFILIANTSARSGDVNVTLVFEDGTTAERTFAVSGRSRFNVDVRAEFPAAIGRRFGAIVESLGPKPADIVVERAMYWDASGQRWAAGTNALATPLTFPQ
jgi:sugar lactone lactonase YvrE